MRAIFLLLWGIWDWIYYHCNRLEYVSKEDNIFRVVRKTYKGPPLQTKNGDWIKDGDAIIKIHLYNYALAKKVLRYNSEVSLALYLKNHMKRSLRGLSLYIEQLPSDTQIKGIIGTSMLNRGAERFGFCAHDVDHSFFYWFKGYLYKLIYISVHPYGLRYIQKHGNRLKSKHLVMSINELYALYLSQERY